VKDLLRHFDGPDGEAQLWEQDTETLLDHIGLAARESCLDLGPGKLGILRPLSRRVGRQGQVICLLPHERHLADARRRIESAALVNVRLTTPPDLGSTLPAPFDLVHARFFLSGHRAPRDPIRPLLDLVRPGGAIAVQEPDASVWPCYPPHKAWYRLTGAIQTILAAEGADPRAGQRAFALLRRAGLEGVRVRTVAVALHDSHPAMRLPIVLAETLRQPITAAGLMSESELDDALRECEQCLLDRETFVTTFLVTQVWGRKPEC
jgi:SAM-dependent methyltransferase